MSHSINCKTGQCEGGRKHYPFGRGSLNDSNVSKVPPTVMLPISPAANDAAESGTPLCLARPETAEDELASFRELASTVSRELLRIHYGDTETEDFVEIPSNSSSDSYAVATVQLSLDKTTSPPRILLRLFSPSGAIQQILHPAELRSRDPKTGDTIEDSPFRDQATQTMNNVVEVHNTGSSNSRKVSPSLIPILVQRKGRYGFAIQWSDGATIIYSKLCLARAAGGRVLPKPVSN